MKSLKEYVFERRVAEDECHTDQQDVDIGGFAKIAGCLEKLKNSKKQLRRPLEEDLASWGHHSSSTTVPDVILQASAGEETLTADWMSSTAKPRSCIGTGVRLQDIVCFGETFQQIGCQNIGNRKTELPPVQHPVEKLDFSDNKWGLHIMMIHQLQVGTLTTDWMSSTAKPRSCVGTGVRLQDIVCFGETFQQIGCQNIGNRKTELPPVQHPVRKGPVKLGKTRLGNAIDSGNQAFARI
ncbi:CHROMATIN REMODELING 25 protein [Nymphaea thermarum]|nr:CHROMATIN REMODELING 25 protein [Nymphaea thermarum]